MKHGTFARGFIGTAAIAALLAACGGGGSHGTSLPPIGGASAGSPQSSARFVISIPHGSHVQSSRTPAYVSPNTRSIAITIGSAPPVTAALTPSAPNCSTVGSAVQCTVSVAAPIGNDTFTVSLYASTNATGTALATQSIAATIVANQLNTVPLTLDGVPANVTLTLSNASPVEGTAATITLTVAAQDASGATIVAPGNYTTPITLSDSDTTGATTLSATRVTSRWDRTDLWVGDARSKSLMLFRGLGVFGLPESVITRAPDITVATGTTPYGIAVYDPLKN